MEHPSYHHQNEWGKKKLPLLAHNSFNSLVSFNFLVRVIILYVHRPMEKERRKRGKKEKRRESTGRKKKENISLINLELPAWKTICRRGQMKITRPCFDCSQYNIMYFQHVISICYLYILSIILLRFIMIDDWLPTHALCTLQLAHESAPQWLMYSYCELRTVSWYECPRWIWLSDATTIYKGSKVQSNVVELSFIKMESKYKGNHFFSL